MKLRILATSAILAAATALTGVSAQASTPTTQAGNALAYLATQQLADGSIDDALGETADYALGGKFQGLNPNNFQASSGKSVYDYLASWVSGSIACTNKANTRDGNSIGKLVQAVVAGGRSPIAFGGRNLLADLEGVGGTSGGAYDASTGTFRDCASGGQNAVYAEANAILGLEAAANVLYPVPPASIQHLRALQSASGGWPVFGVDSSNSTAMALMALGNRLETFCGAPLDPTLKSALTYLHTQQDPASGGFVYSTAYGTPANPAISDPDSDALVIQALVAVLQDPAGATWTNSKGNAPTDILTFQDSTSGGFKFDHKAATTPDAFTTSQVPAGLDRAPFPDGSPHPLAVACPAPTPSTAAAASPAPTLPRAGSGRRGASIPASVLAIALAALAGLPAVARLTHRARAHG